MSAGETDWFNHVAPLLFSFHFAAFRSFRRIGVWNFIQVLPLLPVPAMIYEVDEDDNKDIPDVQECDRLCKEFAKQTNTNEALAQSVLQDHKWNLEDSLKAYRDEESARNEVLPKSMTSSKGGIVRKTGTTSIEITIIDDDEEEGGSSSSSGNSDRETRIAEFISVTNSDRKTAHILLECADWNMEAAVNSFYSNDLAQESWQMEDLQDGNQGDSPASAVTSPPKHELKSATPRKSEPGGSFNPSPLKKAKGEPDRVHVVGRGAVFSPGSSKPLSSGQEAPKTFKLISWNIDGLDDRSLVARAHAACAEILKEKPDVVFLQEVVPSNQQVFHSELSTNYFFFAGADYGYFSNILFKKELMQFESEELVDFSNHEGRNVTRMDRNLVIVRVKFAGIPLTLMTSHLESTKEDEGLRAVQLKICLQKMQRESPERAVIFGGDLNMRAADVKGAGGIPSGIVDVWEALGSKKELGNTWDMKRNTNVASKVNFEGKFAPQCRFDRLYFRPGTSGLQAKHFGLVGLTKVPNSSMFPSDHWGMVAVFGS